MNDKVIIISGTDYNISGIQQLGKTNSDYIAEVIKFNKFGYIGIKVYGKDIIMRRHLSDCEDVRSMIINMPMRNLEFVDGRWVVIHEGKELPSDDVYVVRTNGSGKDQAYIARSQVDGFVTSDITRAWFTFDKQQAIKYATRMSLCNMRVYETLNVADIIKLQHYEKE